MRFDRSHGWLVPTLAGLAVVAACGEPPTQPALDSQLNLATHGGSRASEGSALVALNQTLAELGAGIRIEQAEYVTLAGSDRMGQIVFLNDRGNKQTGLDFVPGDPRREGRANVTYVVDLADGAATGGISSADTEGAIDRAMGTWDAEACSGLAMTKNASLPFDVGVVQAIGGFGGIPAFIPFADIIHAGWLPGPFFDLVRPGGSTFILGVTFTIIFIDANNNPTDIDGNGQIDVAFREIYYNNAFAWGINAATNPVDVETVALHEAGHGLSQAHFGTVFGTLANLRLHFAPFAVMNAAISRQAQSLEGTDRGGHCSIWGSWPNN